MPPNQTSQTGRAAARAFTLLELLVVLAVLGLLALMLLPALAGTNVKSHQAQCLNNLKQLTSAWLMYADENNGRLAGNLGGNFSKEPSNLSKTWCLGWQALTSLSDNFRTDYLQNSQLGKYLGTNISVFKCPADQSTFGYRPRVRSVSMNGYLGDPSAGFKTPGFHSYTKLTQITQPSPSGMFVFIDEREESINDANFIVFAVAGPSNDYIGDWPASYHNRSASLSFADGHVQSHQWTDRRTTPPINHQSPVGWGVASPNNPDVWWLSQHATAPQ